MKYLKQAQEHTRLKTNFQTRIQKKKKVRNKSTFIISSSQGIYGAEITVVQIYRLVEIKQLT